VTRGTTTAAHVTVVAECPTQTAAAQDAPLPAATFQAANTAATALLLRDSVGNLPQHGPAPKGGTQTRIAIAVAELPIPPASATVAPTPTATHPLVSPASTATPRLPAIPFRGPATCPTTTTATRAIVDAARPIPTATVWDAPAQAAMPLPASTATTALPRLRANPCRGPANQDGTTTVPSATADAGIPIRTAEVLAATNQAATTSLATGAPIAPPRKHAPWKRLRHGRALRRRTPTAFAIADAESPIPRAVAMVAPNRDVLPLAVTNASTESP